jgi:CspA family cold shock protein
MATGTVKFFNIERGCGFITPEGGGPDIFLHISAVEAAGMRSVSEGDRVSFRRRDGCTERQAERSEHQEAGMMLVAGAKE